MWNLLNTFPFVTPAAPTGGNITIFAPSDTALAAFLAALPGRPNATGLAASAPSGLASLLLFHILSGFWPTSALPPAGSNGMLATLQPEGGRLAFGLDAVGSTVVVARLPPPHPPVACS